MSVEAAKEGITEETEVLLNSIFIFGIYHYFVVWIVFSKPEEVAVRLGRGVRRIARNILANCELFICSIEFKGPPWMSIVNYCV